MLKLLRFESRWIVSEVEEIPGVEFGDPDCVLKYPCEVTEDGLTTFPPFSDDRELAVRSSDITLIAEPDSKTASLFYEIKSE
jgi:hypothetical protein|tara:strand:+ start:2211 stop:2456 length:246 start_codon:yes stop_codon:yes gene_type:complete